MKKATVRIKLRKDYETQDGKKMVCMRYTAYRRSSLISLNISVLPKNWNSQSMTIRKSVPFADYLNKNIFEIYQKANNIVMENFFKPLPLPEFINRLKDKNHGNTDFYLFIEQEIELLKASRAEGTILNYHKLVNTMKKWKPILQFDDITLDFILGTIFLDEIGELDAACQVKLLRVLQDQTFESLGDSKQKKVDVRVVSATNKNLVEMISKGTFREDLFYRINLISVHIPALRERIDDIPLLINHFVQLHTNVNKQDPIEVSSEAMEYLKKLPYPGNIRELKNLVERTILVSGKSLITDVDFKNQYIPLSSNIHKHSESVYNLEDVERQMVEKAMKLYGGNLSKVATALGLSRPALYRRLEKYGMRKDD